METVFLVHRYEQMPEEQLFKYIYLFIFVCLAAGPSVIPPPKRMSHFFFWGVCVVITETG